MGLLLIKSSDRIWRDDFSLGLEIKQNVIVGRKDNVVLFLLVLSIFLVGSDCGKRLWWWWWWNFLFKETLAAALVQPCKAWVKPQQLLVRSNPLRNSKPLGCDPAESS